MTFDRRTLVKILCLGLCIGVNFFVWTKAGFSQESLLRVSFLDVGQGDAIFIESPSGVQMLVDGGSNRAVIERLAEELSFFDREIDIVVATHPDKDHIGGLPAIFERYDVRVVFDPGISSDTRAYKDYSDSVEREQGVQHLIARAGMRIDLGAGVSADILYPDTVSEKDETNDASIIMRLVYGESEFLLTGDAPQYVERILLSTDTLLQSDVLKAGHHGSKTSSGKTFVEAVRPVYAIISAGAKNPYGHPHAEVLNIFSNANIPVLETKNEGTISFVSNGVRLWRD